MWGGSECGVGGKSGFHLEKNVWGGGGGGGGK